MKVSGGDQPAFYRLQPGPLILFGADRTTTTITGIVDDRRPMAVITMKDLATFGHGPALAVIGDVSAFLIADND